MKTDKVVQFKDWRCNVHLETYVNSNAIAIVLRNADPIREEECREEPDMADIAVATVNLPNINLNPDEVAIKDYSENEGMLKALIMANIVHMPHKFVKGGYSEFPVCKLRIKPEEYEKETQGQSIADNRSGQQS